MIAGAVLGLFFMTVQAQTVSLSLSLSDNLVVLNDKQRSNW